MNTYFLMYLLTLVVDLDFTLVYLLLGGLIFLFLPIILGLEEEDTQYVVKKVGKPFIIVMSLLITVDWLSPTKEEAIFIAVAGMAIEGEVHTKTIDLLGEALDLSEEYLIELKDNLAEDKEERTNEG